MDYQLDVADVVSYGLLGLYELWEALLSLPNRESLEKYWVQGVECLEGQRVDGTWS